MDFVVGTFNTPKLYSLRFEPDAETLKITSVGDALGPHSWLALSSDQNRLYCTTWSDTTCRIAAYRVQRTQTATKLELINSKPVRGRPGYVACSKEHIFTVGGATGEVFAIRSDGGVGRLLQNLEFSDRTGHNMSEQRGAVAHGDFGGLRHGAHSCDVSPDGRTLYVADIGRNCIWTFDVAANANTNTNTNANANAGAGAATGGADDDDDDDDDLLDDEQNQADAAPLKPAGVKVLSAQQRQKSPRTYDGPRHTWPHPNGDVVYCVQEHSNMVDAFRVETKADGSVGKLTLCGAVNILPEAEDPAHYWADEVRLSSGPDPTRPQYLYASTRGLLSTTNGYVAAFALNPDGTFASPAPIDLWMTPTSGGIANAIEPAPWWPEVAPPGKQYLSLTDSEEGRVMVLCFDGQKITKVAEVTLGPDGEKALPADTQPPDQKTPAIEAATAIWLRRQL